MENIQFYSTIFDSMTSRSSFTSKKGWILCFTQSEEVVAFKWDRKRSGDFTKKRAENLCQSSEVWKTTKNPKDEFIVRLKWMPRSKSKLPREAEDPTRIVCKVFSICLDRFHVKVFAPERPPRKAPCRRRATDCLFRLAKGIHEKNWIFKKVAGLPKFLAFFDKFWFSIW